MSDLCAAINEFGKSMGNAARYRIIEALLKGEKTVGELAKIAKVSQPAASQHLKILKSSNLVVDERRGKETYYSANAAHILELLTKLSKEVRKH